MNGRQLHLLITSLLMLPLVAHFGCSPTLGPVPTARETAKVTGHITYGGKPVLRGDIRMLIEGGWFGTGMIEDGEYWISNAPVGQVRVVVSGSTVKAPQEDAEKKKWAEIGKFRERAKKLKAEGKNIDDEPPEVPPEDPNDVPRKYGGDFTSPLVNEVKSGEQVINIDIPKA
jgi:hypothetical protein